MSHERSQASRCGCSTSQTELVRRRRLQAACASGRTSPPPRRGLHAAQLDVAQRRHRVILCHIHAVGAGMLLQQQPGSNEGG